MHLLNLTRDLKEDLGVPFLHLKRDKNYFLQVAGVASLNKGKA